MKGEVKAAARYLARIAGKADSTVYAAISFAGQTCGAARFMDCATARDNRPATPRRVAAACWRLSGYGGQLVREAIICAPVGCDAATVASVAAVLA